MKSVTIGRDTQTGETVSLSEEARYLSLYVLGKTGTGKSNLLAHIAGQDIENGDGLCLLDPHDDLANHVLSYIPARRADDVILLDPTDVDRPFGLNPFACSDSQNVLRATGTADNFIAALGGLAEFGEIFESAPRMKNVLHHLALTFVVNQGHTLAEAPEFLTSPEYRRLFYNALRTDHLAVLRFWERLDGRPPSSQREMVDSSLNKIERFQSNPVMRAIFGQPTSIDFRAAMDGGKIIIVKLNRRDIGEDNAAFIGAFVVWDVLQAALSRSDIPEEGRRPFHLIADEFQTFMTTAFPTLQKESRKFRVDTMVAHQERRTLTEAARAATLVVRNKIIFEAIGQDAAELVSEFKINVPEPPVERYEPKYEIVHNVLEHLKTHGHENEEVLIKFQSVMATLNELFDNADAYLKAVGSGRYATMPAYDLSMRRERFTIEIDQFLYEAMRSAKDRGSEFNMLSWGSEFHSQVINRCLRIISGLVDNLYKGVLDKDSWQKVDYLRKLVQDYWYISEVRELGIERIEREYLPTGITVEDASELSEVLGRCLVERKISSEKFDEKSKRTQAFWDEHPLPDYPLLNLTDLPAYKQDSGWESKRWKWKQAYQIVDSEASLAGMMARLATYLRKQPCYAHTGQLEPVPEKRRLYSDVEAQMVNELTTLPAFTAKCKIVQDGAPHEYLIKTFPPQPVPPNRMEQIRQIRERSRQRYGRDRREVDDAINERLALAPMEKDEEPLNLDNRSEFGEKKAAAKTQKSKRD